MQLRICPKLIPVNPVRDDKIMRGPNYPTAIGLVMVHRRFVDKAMPMAVRAWNSASGTTQRAFQIPSKHWIVPKVAPTAQHRSKPVYVRRSG